MDGEQRRKIEAKRPPYWSSQKAVVTAVLSMKALWDIQEDDPNNAFLIKQTCDKEQMQNTDVHDNQTNKMELKISKNINQIMYKIK